MALTQKQKAVLNYIKTNKNNGHTTSISAVSIHFFLTLRNATNILYKLIDKGEIKKVDSFSYTINDQNNQSEL